MDYQYAIRISKKSKQISLKISPQGLTIVSPTKLSSTEVDILLREHQGWLEKHHQQLEAAEAESKLKDGATIPIFGDWEKIVFREIDPNSPAKVRDNPQAIEVHAPTGEHLQILRKWLRKTAGTGIKSRVEELAAAHSFKYQKVAIREQSSRWGSCSTLQNLNFNWRLVFAPLEVMDYVILHELAHTRHMNHSPQFWELVGNCQPEYKTHRQWLKKNGYQLYSY